MHDYSFFYAVFLFHFPYFRWKSHDCKKVKHQRHRQLIFWQVFFFYFPTLHGKNHGRSSFNVKTIDNSLSDTVSLFIFRIKEGRIMTSGTLTLSTSTVHFFDKLFFSFFALLLEEPWLQER